MNRRAVLTLLTGSSLVQAATNAAGAVVATMLLGPAERGVMVLALTIGSVVAVLAGLGTGSALRARLPGTAGPARRGLLAAYAWWSLAAAGLAALLVAVVAVLAGPAIDPALARPSFVVAAAVTCAGSSLLAQQTDVWFAAGAFRDGGIWAGAASAAGLAAMLAAALAGRSAWLLLLAQGLGTLAVVGAAGVRLRAAGLLTFGAPARAELRSLVRIGTPVLGATVGFVLAMRADRVILGAAAGAAAVGVYSLAATMSELPRSLPGAVGQLLLRDVAVGADAATLRRAVRLALGLTLAAAVAIAVAGWALIVPLFGPEFAGARPALLVLLMAEVALAPYGIAIRGLVGGSWTRAAGTLGALGGAVGVGLFVLLIPLWTTMGAAMACVGLYGGLSVASWSLLRRRVAAAAVDAPPVAPVPAGRA